MRRARHLGADLSGGAVALIGKLQDPHTEGRLITDPRLVRRFLQQARAAMDLHWPRSLVDWNEGRLLALLPATSSGSGDPPREEIEAQAFTLGKRLLGATRETVPGLALTLALSRYTPEPERLGVALDEARLALSIGERLGRVGEVVTFEETGTYKLLFQIFADRPEELISFYDQTIAPRGYFAAEVRQGEVFRIIDVEGQQVADFLCFNLDRLEEKLSPPNPLLLNGQIFPEVGYTLYSDEAGKLMTITADTCGTHDMIAGGCTRFTNELRYGVKDTPNCRDNFVAALEPWGITWKEIPYNMNVFMNCPVQPDGGYSIELPESKAGDYADFTADIDVLVAMSNCPQERNKCNGFQPTPMRVIHYRPE